MAAHTTSLSLLRRAALLLALLGAAAAAAADSGRASLRRTPSPPPALQKNPVFLQSRDRQHQHQATSGRSHHWAFKLTTEDVPCAVGRQALRVHV